MLVAGQAPMNCSEFLSKSNVSKNLISTCCCYSTNLICSFKKPQQIIERYLTNAKSYATTGVNASTCARRSGQWYCDTPRISPSHRRRYSHPPMHSLRDIDMRKRINLCSKHCYGDTGRHCHCHRRRNHDRTDLSVGPFAES
jgi:hypothetical protein